MVRKDAVIYIPIAQEDRDKIKRAAQADGRSVADWSRRTLLEKANGMLNQEVKK